MHGGTVGVESAGLGQGATFRITLPLSLPDELSYKAPRTAVTSSEIGMSDPELKLSGLRALVVDDQADERDMLAAALSMIEAEVRTASNITEAMKIATAWRPEIVISDIAMPEGGGYELIRRMRSVGIKAPAIAITAYASDEDRLRALAAGFQMHLPKPAEICELVLSIASLTGRLT
jgi:CheY-like chemotaxis protein